MTADNSETYQTNILYEKEVQAYLAANLELLGNQELTLVQMEYPVKFGNDAGRIDILAIGKDDTFFVIEIKRGVAGRGAIGQLQSYMGAISDSNPGKRVRGILVCLSIDEAARAALRMTHSIDHFEFKTRFEFHRSHLGKDKATVEASQEAAIRPNYWKSLGGSILN